MKEKVAHSQQSKALACQRGGCQRGAGARGLGHSCPSAWLDHAHGWSLLWSSSRRLCTRRAAWSVPTARICTTTIVRGGLELLRHQPWHRGSVWPIGASPPAEPALALGEGVHWMPAERVLSLTAEAARSPERQWGVTARSRQVPARRAAEWRSIAAIGTVQT